MYWRKCYPDLYSRPEGRGGNFHGSFFVQSLEKVHDALIFHFEEFLRENPDHTLNCGVYMQRNNLFRVLFERTWAQMLHITTIMSQTCLSRLTWKTWRADMFLVTELMTLYRTSRAGRLWRASSNSSTKASHTNTDCTHIYIYTHTHTSTFVA